MSDTHDCDCADKETVSRFRALWASYSEALGMNSFTMSPEDRQANEQQVASAYQALSKLAQGV